MAKGRRISITLTRDDELYLRAYLRQKKRWKDLPALFRDGGFQLVARNPLTPDQVTRAVHGDGNPREGRSAVLRGGSGANSEEGCGAV